MKMAGYEDSILKDNKMRLTKTKLREIIKQEIHKLDEGVTPLKLSSVKTWVKNVDSQLSTFLFDGFDGWDEMEDAGMTNFEKFEDTVIKEMLAGFIKALKKSY